MMNKPDMQQAEEGYCNDPQSQGVLFGIVPDLACLQGVDTRSVGSACSLNARLFALSVQITDCYLRNQ